MLARKQLILPKRSRLYAPNIIRPKPPLLTRIPLAVCSQGGGVAVTPGNQTFNTSGTFIVPPYTTLTVYLWGGGGAGATYDDITSFEWVTGGNGSATTFQGMTAGGGNGGGYSTGTGGTASGGDTNTNGANSSTPTGGTAPGSGGAGGTAPGSDGNGTAGTAPGGGGGSAKANGGEFWYGGGSGAYCVKTYASGALTVGASLSVTVGAGGTPVNTSFDGGAGAAGRAYFVWS